MRRDDATAGHGPGRGPQARAPVRHNGTAGPTEREVFRAQRVNDFVVHTRDVAQRASDHAAQTAEFLARMAIRTRPTATITAPHDDA